MRSIPSIVVTDVVMPRMDGYTLCRAIKADPVLRDTPVILLTALSSPEDVVEGLACGADNFVRKPYEESSLLARVGRSLAGSVPAGAYGSTITAEREQVLDFLFSTFEETLQLDGALTRSYHSLDLLYRLAEGLNRCTSEREVVVEALARALELPHVAGAWIEVGDERRRAGQAGSESGEETVVQLRSGERVLGSMHLLGPGSGMPGEDELQSVGNQVGAALERALLQEHLERRVQERTAALTAEVAARRRAEEAGRALAAIVESADDGMVRHSLDGRIETWNAGAARLYGYSGAEAMGRSIDLLVDSERAGELRGMRARVAGGESVQGYETVRLTRDGAPIDVSLTLSPVRDEQGEIVGIAEIARDITAAKALEGQLLQAQKLESVGRLAGGIAHDFNNLLTAVIGFAELGLHRVAADDPVRGYLQEITRAGERATSLTQRLLAFGRRQTLRLEVLDLDAVVRDLETLLGRLIGDEIDLTVSLGGEGWTVKADRSQIEQVVMNLAVNARDAMPDGGRLTIATRGDGDHLSLTVSDTGVGMDAETRSHVFEPFFTTKPEGKGTGLGLSTVFGIVSQSEGTITVDSAVGLGTTFTIALPRSGEPLAPGADAASASGPATGSERILVVEDEDGVRLLVSMVLREAGYDVSDAPGPEEALLLASEPFDLLITDLLMPGMSGRELAERIRADRPSTPVLYISGYTGDVMMDRGLLTAGDRFLTKPFAMHELHEQVRAILDAS